MSPVPDLKKLRREYLREKGKGYTVQTVGAIFYVPSMALTVICSIPTIFVVVMCVGALLLPPHTIRPIDSTFLVLMAGTVIFGVVACWSKRVMQTGEKIAQVPYVPPVTPSTLPTEEVLVRGAEEPSVSQATLLRINQAPAIEVHIIKSGEAPGGLGEAGTTASLPSISNAIL